MIPFWTLKPEGLCEIAGALLCNFHRKVSDSTLSFGSLCEITGVLFRPPYPLHWRGEWMAASYSTFRISQVPLLHCINKSHNYVECLRDHSPSESIATPLPFGPILGHNWFFQISSQWESQKNRFAFISFGKNPVFTFLHLRSLVHAVPH